MSDFIKEVEEELTADQFGRELTLLLYRTFDSLFEVPLFKDITDLYDLAIAWNGLSLSVKTSNSNDATTRDNLIYFAAKSLRPTAGVMFEYSEEAESEFADEDNADSVYEYEVTYTYPTLLINFYDLVGQLRPFITFLVSEENDEAVDYANAIIKKAQHLQNSLFALVHDSKSGVAYIGDVLELASLIDKLYQLIDVDTVEH